MASEGSSRAVTGEHSFPGLLPLGKRPFQYLTNDPSYLDARPVFSPDGNRVLFMRSPVKDSNSSALWIVPADGGGKAQVFFEKADLQATRPDWSRSRTSFEIAFTGVSKKGLGLYLLDAQKKKTEIILPPGQHQWSYPSWYPDGKSLAATNYDSYVHRVFRADLSGNLTPLTDSAAVWAGMSSVSAADDHPITFAGQTPAPGPPPPPDGYNQNANQIWIQEPGQPPFQIDSLQARAPWWSPCGKYIAFESNRASSKPENYLIFIYARGAGAVVSVTPYALNVQHAKWAPDGKKIVFAVAFPGGGGGIAVVDLARQD